VKKIPIFRRSSIVGKRSEYAPLTAKKPDELTAEKTDLDFTDAELEYLRKRLARISLVTAIDENGSFSFPFTRLNATTDLFGEMGLNVASALHSYDATTSQITPIMSEDNRLLVYSRVEIPDPTGNYDCFIRQDSSGWVRPTDGTNALDITASGEAKTSLTSQTAFETGSGAYSNRLVTFSVVLDNDGANMLKVNADGSINIKF